MPTTVFLVGEAVWVPAWGLRCRVMAVRAHGRTLELLEEGAAPSVVYLWWEARRCERLAVVRREEEVE